VTEHPITPPPELVGQWLTEAADLQLLTPSNLNYLATQAARWGADQELEACVELWANNSIKWTSSQLRDDRRPKPPSLKEQALAILSQGNRIPTAEDWDTIRRALEALPND
jgi:hypothetical protein